MKKVLFLEKRKMPPIFSAMILTFMLIVLIYAGFAVYADDPEFLYWFILIGVVSVASVSIVFFVAVELKITNEGVEYRISPFPNRKVILSKDSVTLRVTELQAYRQFGRSGIRIQKNKKYLLTSRYNLLITYKSSTILIGTKKPKELQRVIDTIKAT